MSSQSLMCRGFSVRRFTAAALTLLLLVQTTGCISWDPQTRPRPALEKAKPNAIYRITVAGGMVYRLTNVRVQGDSLFGIVSPRPPTSGPRKAAPIQVALPWSQVNGVERRTNETGTILLVTVALTAAFTAVISRALQQQ